MSNGFETNSTFITYLINGNVNHVEPVWSYDGVTRLTLVVALYSGLPINYGFANVSLY